MKGRAAPHEALEVGAVDAIAKAGPALVPAAAVEEVRVQTAEAPVAVSIRRDVCGVVCAGALEVGVEGGGRSREAPRSDWLRSASAASILPVGAQVWEAWDSSLRECVLGIRFQSAKAKQVGKGERPS